MADGSVCVDAVAGSSQEWFSPGCSTQEGGPGAARGWMHFCIMTKEFLSKLMKINTQMRK